MKVTKDGRTMSLKDGNQLAAFLNNGWEKADDAPKKAKAVKVEAEVAEDKPVGEAEKAEKPKTTTTTRRKRTTAKTE